MLLLLAESYLHRLDPVVFPIAGDFKVRWYGLAYLFGFVLAWVFYRWMARPRPLGEPRGPLPPEAVSDYLFFIIVGVLVGGRLGYIVFYRQEMFIGFTSAFPWWDVLALQKGGMASHGGVIGFIVATLLYAKRRGYPALRLLDLGAFVAGFALGVGRIANFVNAELGGRIWRGTGEPPPWTIKYPQEILEPGFPRRDAVADALHPIVGGGETFFPRVVELARAGDRAVIEALTPLLTPYWPSQIIQAITDGVILMLLLTVIWIRPRRPGVIGSWFLIGYGVLRILSETVREPDTGVALILGLTRGQVLSVVMVLAGIVSLAVVSRRPVPPVAGWCRAESTERAA